METPDADERLSVQPGTQAGWRLPLVGRERCEGFGHELNPVLSYMNGFLVGYCVRCDARVEIPWFRGGTMSVLGATMAAEAARMRRPATSVVEDLAQVAGLLEEDLAQVEQTLRAVRRAQRMVERRRP